MIKGSTFCYFILMLMISTKFLTAQPEMILVEGGRFVMGCTPEQGGECDSDEYPAHAVQVSSFYIGKYEVTQGQWQVVMGDNPSYHTGCGTYCPVENIDWYSMIVFCNVLTLQQMGSSHRVYYKDAAMTQPWSISDYSGGGVTPAASVYWNSDKNGYRLPTEAEWEFAARGGNLSQSYKYSGNNDISEVAWFSGNSGGITHTVGTKGPNELSIYDMSGNVWEIVWDWYINNFNNNSHICNPSGPVTGTYRIEKGGCCVHGASYCRVSGREDYDPSVYYFYGLRLARSL